eukprot:1510517-Rhodomonas_salina.4
MRRYHPCALLRFCYALSGTGMRHTATLLLCDARYWHRVRCYAFATRCPVLRQGVLVPGKRWSWRQRSGRLKRFRPIVLRDVRY